MIDRTLLSALVAVSDFSMRDISRTLEWPQSNMSAAFHGARPLPPKWVFPLLDTLGLTDQALPRPQRPWHASGNETEDREVLLKVLQHFFRSGAVVRQISPDSGIAALKVASRETVYGVRDRRGVIRVCLIVKRVPEDLDDPDGPEPSRFSDRDLEKLGFDCQPRVRVPNERYSRWRAGKLTNREFDEDILARKVREPTWKDVVEAAKRRGISPADGLAAILDLKSE